MEKASGKNGGIYRLGQNGQAVSRAPNQKGQATVEYVLLLVLTLAILLGLSTKVFTPVKRWSDFYMGTYTNCLLDSGSLPNIAGGAPTDCDQLAAAEGLAGGNNSTANANANAQKQQALENAARVEEQAGRRAQGSRKNYNSPRRSGLNQDLNTPKGADGAPADENVTNVGSLSRDGARRFANNTTGPRIAKKVEIRGLWEDEREKIRRREDRVTRKDTDSNQDLKPRKMPFNPPQRKSATVDEQEEGFTFGGLFRIAFMLIIIVAILYVLGIQINSITKSMEK